MCSLWSDSSDVYSVYERMMYVVIVVGYLSPSSPWCWRQETGFHFLINLPFLSSVYEYSSCTHLRPAPVNLPGNTLSCDVTIATAGLPQHGGLREIDDFQTSVDHNL